MCCNCLKCDKKSPCKCICGGVLIWVVAFMVASLFVAFKMGDTLICQLVTYLAAIFTAYTLGKKTGITSKMKMLGYSFCSVVVILLLDYFITTKFTGMKFFAGGKVWIAYILILLAPMAAIKSGSTPPTPQQ
jgi:hypothetical protein